ncbi:myb/SANT-like DNA-binding domain-containing protein 4 [Ostrea edulis]|uniref:myb/SANT-like DNA-binding domain-containing protein 4 n=1 Tax=Ostrea edulis TaxID=37623 RepID=UPI0024AFA8A3|nr:myb/SANT-like DNA-binding domain-containing protein 4 [Ostrea edulis]XP_056014155.1 myb/SANT-like DNA-binding domain-containing protein 4 [Ostrea edulis]
MADQITDEKRGKKRKANWTQDECLMLVTMVNEKKNILRSKLGPSLTSRMKKEAWEELSERLNASAVNTQRTVEEVEKKWHNLLSTSKAEISSYRKTTNGTGGGPPPKPLSAIAETVQMVIGEENAIIDGVQGGIDSSLLQLLTNDGNICNVQIIQSEPEFSMTLPPIIPLSPRLPLPAPLHVPSASSSVPAGNTCTRCAKAQTDNRNRQSEIEEMTIRKLHLEIEYYEMKLKKLKEE